MSHGYSNVRRPRGAHRVRRADHNAAKQELLRWAARWLAEPLRVREIACGKGGDINKLAALPVHSYLGTDICASAVQEARRRAQQCGRPSWEFGTCDGGGSGRGASWNIVSMQFALQFFCESEARARQLLARVSALLRTGGLFVGSCPHELSVPIKADAPPWGAAYTYTLSGLIDEQREWRVPQLALRQLAARHGLRLMFWRRIDNFLRGAGLPSSSKQNSAYVVFAFIKCA